MPGRDEAKGALHFLMNHAVCLTCCMVFLSIGIYNRTAHFLESIQTFYFMTTVTASINPQRVEAIFRDCLFRDGEDCRFCLFPNVANIEFERATFHSGRVETHAPEISLMLDELPSGFKKDQGGGMVWDEACKDRHGRQWTDLDISMEQLFQLGFAIKKVSFLFPAAFWLAPVGRTHYAVG